MRRIDWRALLVERSVPFVERGANVKRGELNIRCPFCGPADPSHHMGINPDNGWWACWRNSQHRGKSPVRLLMAMLRIPYREACEIAGVGEDYVDPEGFDALAARILGAQKIEQGAKASTTRRLRWPRGYVRLQGVSWVRRHRGYLRSRGFSFIDDLVEDFDIRGTLDDPGFRDRVILPYKLDGSLVAWTGRAIAPAEIRYRDLRLDDCIVPIKHTLFLHDHAAFEGGKWLIFVEGPVDALKLTFYGQVVGVFAVALSTSTISEQQVAQAVALADQFDNVGVMADNEDSLDIINGGRLRDQLAMIPNIRALPVPFSRKDAGALTAEETMTYANDLATRRRS